LIKLKFLLFWTLELFWVWFCGFSFEFVKILKIFTLVLLFEVVPEFEVNSSYIKINKLF
jgi:hypothetical protein